MNYQQGYDDGVQQGYDEGIQQARSSHSAGIPILLVLAMILWKAFVYAPLLLAGYWLANMMSAMYGDGWFIKSLLTLVFAVLAAGIIYFFKGMLISLRMLGNKLWLLLAAICIILACGIQCFTVFALLQNEMKVQHIPHYSVWSGMISLLVAVLICSYYRFFTNVAPSPLLWFYEGGINLVQWWVFRKRQKEPINASMKVVHKKE